MAVNTTWYCSSAGYTAVPAWTLSTVKAAGALVRPTAAAAGNERVFVCTIAGTTNPTEPTWVNTKGARPTDNTVTWQECTGQPAVNGDVVNTPASSAVRSTSPGLGQIIKNNAGTHYFIMSTAGACAAGEPTFNTTTGGTTTDNTGTWTCIGPVGSFTAWKAPHARIANAIVATWATTGDNVYVSSAHAETQATALSISPAGLMQFLCIADAGTIPPTAADLTTGASVTTTGNSTITIGHSYYQGIAFNCATGAFGTLLNVGTGTNTYVSMKNCALNMRATAGGAYVFGNVTGSKIELVNTTIGFGGSTGELFGLAGCQFIWRDTPSALSAVGGTWPNNPFRGTVGTMFVENVDLSAFAGNAYWNVNAGPVKAIFSRCKLANIVMIGSSSSAGHAEVDVVDCDTGGATYRHERWQPYEGNQVIETTAVRTGGASDGTTTYSWKITTQVTTRWQFPFESLPVSIWNTTIGSSVTMTLEGCLSGTALPNNDDIWLDASYLGTAGSTLGSRVSQTKATTLTTAAALTASTVAWDGAASARVNSQAYALGAFIKVASNPGRLFICTSAGTSAGSEPGGYASAVDGGSVTDSGATFRAMVRFKLAVAMTPQIAGYIIGRVRVGKFSSIYFVDPKPVLS